MSQTSAKFWKMNKNRLGVSRDFQVEVRQVSGVTEEKCENTVSSSIFQHDIREK
jgi:hypothetical protein